MLRLQSHCPRSMSALAVLTVSHLCSCPLLAGMSGLSVGKDREGAEALMRALLKKPNDSAMNKEAIKYRSETVAAQQASEKQQCPLHLGRFPYFFALTALLCCVLCVVSAKLGPVYDELECKVDPTHCRAKQASRTPIGVLPHTPATDTDVEQLASNQIGQLPAGGHHEYGGHEDSANLSLLYALIALLLVSNVATVLLLKKGKAAAACMPPGLGLAMGIGGPNEKQV